MGIKFTNNASSNIIHVLPADATSVSITPDTGDLFPYLAEGDYFYATLAGNNGLEIVKVTNRVNDTMTIVRAQDNTTALSFDTGDLFELRIVAADFNDTFSEVNDKLEASIEETISTVNSALSSKAPILHASSSTEFGTGTSTQYGHLKSHDEPDATKTAATGHAFSPAGAAVQDAKIAGKLDKSGGTMTGELVVKQLVCAPHNNVTEGGELTLAPSTPSQGTVGIDNLDGGFRVIQYPSQDGAQAGTYILEWDHRKGILRAQGADILTSAGGTMTGRLTLRPDGGGAVNAPVDNNYLLFFGGTDYRKGGYVQIFGKDHPNKPGYIAIVPDNGITHSVIHFIPDGSIATSSGKVLTSAGGSVTEKLTFASQRVIDSTNANGLFIVADANKDSSKTGSFACFPVEHANSTRNGGFECSASDGENVKRLIGHYLHGLTWGGKSVVTLEASGNGYLRFSNGTQICMQWCEASTSTKTISLPMPFVDKNYYFMHTILGDSDYLLSFNAKAVDGASFTCRAHGPISCHVVTIGKWK